MMKLSDIARSSLLAPLVLALALSATHAEAAPQRLAPAKTTAPAASAASPALGVHVATGPAIARPTTVSAHVTARGEARPATPSLDVSVSRTAQRKQLTSVHRTVTKAAEGGAHPVVVFDIDDTLLTWPKGDTPRQVVPGALEYVKSLKEAGATIVYITGRHEPQRRETLAQLHQYGFPAGPNEHLFLNDTSRPTVEFKATTTRAVVKNLGTPVAVFDNERGNARMFREELPGKQTAVVRLNTASSRPDPGGMGHITVINDFTH